MGLALTALFLLIVQGRDDGSALFVGADRGSFWSEHLGRFEAVQQVPIAWPVGFNSDPVAMRTFLVAADQRFPPGLYAWGALVGQYFGHGAEAVCRSMSLWWLLLAAATGLVAARIAEWRPWSFVAAYGATLAIPGLGSLALTYFFDLPMIALIWTALAAWVLLERVPPLAGVVAGVLVFAAALFKWTALPIGGLMLACVAGAGLIASWDWKKAVGAVVGLAIALGTMWWAFTTWRGFGGSSFDHMMAITATAKVSADVNVLQLGPWTLPTVEWEGRRLLWYAVRSVTQVVGPLVAVPLGIGVALGARGRAGWLCLLALAVHAGFYLVLVPPMDARFLMTAAPVLAVAAACGWLRLGRRGGALAVVTIAVGALTLAEFHHGEEGRWNQLWPQDPQPEQVLAGRGVFLDVGDRLTGGWPRARSNDPFLPQREALWNAIIACDRPGLLLPADSLGRTEDAPWFLYRNVLARLEKAPRIENMVDTGLGWADADLSALPELPERSLLLLGGVDRAPPPPGPGWTLHGRYAVDDRRLALWGRGDGPICDLGDALPPDLDDGDDAGSWCRPGASVGFDFADPPESGREVPTADGSCDDLGPDCAAPYLRAAEILNESPAPCDELLEELAAARAVDRSSDVGDAWSEGRGMAAVELGAVLNARLTGAESSELAVLESAMESVPGGTRRDFILRDRPFGPRRVVLFLPEGPGPHPGVVALLGHDQTVQQFMDDHAGQQLLESGVAIVVPVPRAYDSDEAEDRATRALLCAGSSMVAARITETRTALRLLSSRQEVCADRHGVLAHSGGSTVANLLAWIQPDLRGIVTDMEGRYNAAREDGPNGSPLLRDETHPGLRPLNLRVIDFTDAPVPTLRVRYGMPEGPDAVVEFLNRALRSEDRVGQPPPLAPPE